MQRKTDQFLFRTGIRIAFISLLFLGKCAWDMAKPAPSLPPAEGVVQIKTEVLREALLPETEQTKIELKNGTCLSVLSPTTLSIETEEGTNEIQLVGIEPFDETPHPANDSLVKERLTKLVHGKAVRIIYLRKASIPEIRGYIDLNGKDVAQTLLSEGLMRRARVYHPRGDKYLSEEANAQQAKAGFWARRDATPSP